MHLHIDTGRAPMTIHRVHLMSNVQGNETMLKYPSTLKMRGEIACRNGKDSHLVKPVTSNIVDVPSRVSQKNNI